MKTLKQHILYFRKVRRDLKLLFVIALTTFVALEFLMDVPAKYRWMYHIAVISSRISAAYVTAFFFYYLVNHMQSQKDNQFIASLLKPHSYSLMSLGTTIHDVIAKKSAPTDEDYSLDTLKRVIGVIDLSEDIVIHPTDEEPVRFTIAEDWNMRIHSMHYTAKEIWKFAYKLDAERLSLLHLIINRSKYQLKASPGKLEEDTNAHVRYRIAELAHFAFLFNKHFRDYKSDPYARDEEWGRILRSNVNRMMKKAIPGFVGMASETYDDHDETKRGQSEFTQ